MAPVLNHHFRDFADKDIVFDDQYYGHPNSPLFRGFLSKQLLVVSRNCAVALARPLF